MALVVGLVVVLLAAAGAGAFFLLGGDDDGDGAATAGPDAPSGELAASIRINATPNSVAYGNGRVWVGTAKGELLQIDPATNQLVGERTKLGRGPVAVVSGPEGLYVLVGREVKRLDPRTLRELANVGLAGPGVALAVDDEAVWLTRSPQRPDRNSVVVTLDPETLDRFGERLNVGHIPVDVDVSGGQAWITGYGDGTLTRVSEDGKRATQNWLAAQPTTSALFGGTAWVADFAADAVLPASTKTGLVNREPIRVPHPLTVTTVGDGIWVTSLESADPNSPASLYRFDAESGRITGRPVDLGPSVGYVTAGGDSLWIAARGQRSILRVTPSDPVPARGPGGEKTDPTVMHVGEIEGRVADRRFVAPYAVSLRGKGWLGVNTRSRSVTVARNDTSGRGFAIMAPLVGYTLDGNAQRLRNLDEAGDIILTNGRIIVSEIERAELGGLNGFRLVMTANKKGDRYLCEHTCVPLFGAGASTIAAEGDRTEMYLLRKGKRVIVVAVYGRDKRVQRALDSLRFRPS
jgi:hypothetical protein